MYRYNITVNGTTTEIYPANSGRTRKRTRQKDGYYKEELTGTIQLNKSGYDLIKSYEAANPKIILLIEQFVGGVWKHYFQGYFYAWDCAFDEDKCNVTIKLTHEDAYTGVLKDFDKQFNIISLLRQNLTVTANYTGGSVYEFRTVVVENYNVGPGKIEASNGTDYILNNQLNSAALPTLLKDFGDDNIGSNKWRLYQAGLVWTTAPTWTLVGPTLYENDNTAVCNAAFRYIREIRYIVANEDGTHTSPGTDWELVQTLNYIGATLFKYAKLAGPSTMFMQYKYRVESEVELTSKQDKDNSIYYIQVTEAYINTVTASEDFVNKFGSLYGVINWIYKQVSGVTLTNAVKSDLFFPLNGLNPLNGLQSDYSFSIYDGVNFKIRNILICQKSDYKNPLATEPATKGELSLKDCLDGLLSICGNAGWYINTSGQLVIEHATYFENGLTYGLPATGTAIDIRTENEVTRANKYSYDNSRMVNIIRIKYAEAQGIEFTGLDTNLTATINSEEPAIDEKTITKFTADIDYVNSSPGSISNDNFVIVVGEKDYTMPADSYQIVNGTGPLTQILTTNYLFTITKLFDTFYKQGLPFAEAQINGQILTTTKTLKNKKQNTFSIAKYDGETNPYCLYRTGLGYSIVADEEHIIDENKLRLNLLVL